MPNFSLILVLASYQTGGDTGTASSASAVSPHTTTTAPTTTSSTTPVNVYLYAGDQIIENVTMGYFYYQDSLGNTSHVSDAAGNLLERYTYSAFGIPTFYNASGTLIGNSSYGIRHLFQGQLWTQETGLNDYRNRVELPVMGVFLQPDPIGFKGDAANIYRFCNNNAVNQTDPMGLLVDRTWDRLMYEQGGSQRSFDVQETIKDLHSNGWVTVGHVLFTERNKTDSTPGKPARNLGGSSLDKLGGEMARMAFNTGPSGQEQISWLFEKNGTPGAYAASVPIPGGAEPKQFKEERNQPRLGVSATPTFIPKGYHYVGFAYSHLLADKVIPLIDRQRAWGNRLDAYLAVPHQGSSFPDVLKPYHYDPNVFPTN